MHENSLFNNFKNVYLFCKSENITFFSDSDRWCQKFLSVLTEDFESLKAFAGLIGSERNIFYTKSSLALISVNLLLNATSNYGRDFVSSSLSSCISVQSTQCADCNVFFINITFFFHSTTYRLVELCSNLLYKHRHNKALLQLYTCTPLSITLITEPSHPCFLITGPNVFFHTLHRLSPEYSCAPYLCVSFVNKETMFQIVIDLAFAFLQGILY